MNLQGNKYSTNILMKKTAMDYKDSDLLTQYVTEQGKILPKRITGLSTKQQKKITKSIKRARILSLIPFVNK